MNNNNNEFNTNNSEIVKDKKVISAEQIVKMKIGRENAKKVWQEIFADLIRSGMDTSEAAEEADKRAMAASKPETIKVGNRKVGNKIVAKSLSIGTATVELDLNGALVIVGATSVTINGKVVA